jgi:hypothetical protein
MISVVSRPGFWSVQARVLNVPSSDADTLSVRTGNPTSSQNSGGPSASAKSIEPSPQSVPVKKPPPGYDRHVFSCGQWDAYVGRKNSDGKVKSYTIVNNDNTKKGITSRYYAAVNGPYGNPFLLAEPDLGLPLPQNISIIHPLTREPVRGLEGKVTGIVVKNDKGELLLRSNLTNLNDNGGTIELSDDGVLTLGKLSEDKVLTFKKYYFNGVCLSDKNKVFAIDGYFLEVDPKKDGQGKRIVELKELGDVF